MIAIVTGAGMVAAKWPSDDVALQPSPIHWVRTSRGWEKAAWRAAPAPREVLVHPAMLSTFIVGIAAIAVSLSSRAASRPKKNPGRNSYAGPERRLRNRRVSERRAALATH